MIDKRVVYLVLGLILGTVVLAMPQAVLAGCGDDAICVDADAIGLANGLSWTDAFTNVQDALTFASVWYVREIWVAEGVYYPDEGAGQSDNDRTMTFTLLEDFVLYGGFAGTEDFRDERDWAVYLTILSGDIDGNDMNDDGNFVAETWGDIQGSNAYNVVTIGIGTLDGFTITAGSADGSDPHEYGGGIYSEIGSWSLRNVILSGNQATYGGGMYNRRNEPDSPILTNVTFAGNWATLGGGLMNEQSSPMLTDVIISGNQADDCGGGMLNYDNSNPALIRVSFSDNRATYGGGMYNIDYSNPMLTDVIFNDNQATDTGDGGGMYNAQSAPVLTDVTFSGNRASRGGGMYSHMSDPALTNVVFNANQADDGGGMHNYENSNPILTGVTFNANQASYGGGMCNEQSGPTLTNTTFIANHASNDGGGMYNDYSSPILTDVTFSGNQATSYGNGGGMGNNYSSSTLTNVTFSGNWANQDGGGLYNNNSDATLINVTFGGNQAAFGGGLSNAYQSSAVLVNCILWGNTASIAGMPIYNSSDSNSSVTYSDVQGGYLGIGNFDADPRFVRPPDDGGDGWGNANDDYGDLRLRSSSPAIDAGNNLSVTTTTDRDGQPRYYEVLSSPNTGNGVAPLVDLGAYESQVRDVWLDQFGIPTTPLVSGIPITYILTFGNAAANTVSNVELTDFVSEVIGDVTYTASLPFTHTPGTTYVWQFPDLAVGDVGVLTLTGVVSAGVVGPLNITNTAMITAGGEIILTDNMAMVRSYLPGIYYVNHAAIGADTGLVWADAFTSLSVALHVAQWGDEVWVVAGVYTPTNEIGPEATLRLQSGVAVYGGFVGNETLRAQRDWAMHPTILSGDLDSNDTADSYGVVTTTMAITGSNAYHVISSYGAAETTYLDGFIITAGNASGNYPPRSYLHDCGGGMYNAGSHPTLTNITFSGNHASSNGGGMCNFSSSPTLTDVTFNGNQADHIGGGGGMYNYYYSSPALTRVTFHSNHNGGMQNNYYSSPILTNVIFSSNPGGGIVNYWHSNSTLINVTFSGNQTSYGAGMKNSDSDPTLINVIFSGNQATYGSGMYNSNSNPTLTNVTFSGNRASADGGGMFNDHNSNPILVNCILWGNTTGAAGAQIYNTGSSTPTITYSDIQGGYTGVGNLDADPRFVDPVNGNLRLGYGSPAIDAGNSLSVTIATDLDGHPRIAGGAVDMGAYEVEIATWTPTIVEWHNFGSPCGRVWFTDTGTLTHFTFTLTYGEAGHLGGGLTRRYDAVAIGGHNYQARLELCYEDAELTTAGISLEQEANLHIYRWDAGAAQWIAHSTVNTVTNRIIADDLQAFGVFGIGVTDNAPTNVSMYTLRNTHPQGVLYLLGGVFLVFGALLVLRKRR